MTAYSAWQEWPDGIATMVGTALESEFRVEVITHESDLAGVVEFEHAHDRDLMPLAADAVAVDVFSPDR
jgi:hypothetical protein